MTAPMAAAPFPVVRPCDLRASAASTTPWLIDQLWTAQAVGIIGGTPKSFKTWMALEMAVAVASGSACLATFAVPSPGPVLLYADRKSTRLNSSHTVISYAVFCLKKKKQSARHGL